MKRIVPVMLAKTKLLFTNPGYVLSSVGFELRNGLTRIGIIRLPKQDLVIIDDIFPFKASLFRYNEFNHYYQVFAKVKVFTTGLSLSLLSAKDRMPDVIAEYERQYPKRKIGIFNPHRRVSARLTYCLFLHNTYSFLDYFEKCGLNFAFCLYPGGNFSLSNEESEMMLRKIMQSPFFRHVIVTQNVTKNYLLEKKLCPEDKISFIYGVVSSGADEGRAGDEKKYYGNGKESLDICFVANKYTERGVDKGFDIFESVAVLAREAGMQINFHVVGTFSERDLLDPGHGTNIRFYGIFRPEELRAFFMGMDIILSPNRANTLLKGGFDGFPTGSCIEASLGGALMMVSDELGQNIYYKDEQDILVIRNNAETIFDRIRGLYTDPSRLRSLAEQGLSVTTRIFSDDFQLTKRKATLEALINSGQTH